MQHEYAHLCLQHAPRAGEVWGVDEFDEYPMLPVRELSAGWWIYVTGGGVDEWVLVKAVVPPHSVDTDQRWTVHCERGDEVWLMRATPGTQFSVSAIVPEADFPL